MLKIFKQVIVILLGILTVHSSASEMGFTAKLIAKNVYSIEAPSYGLPTAKNKGWNSNSHFIVTNNGVLVFDTGSSEAIGKGILKTISSITKQPVRWVVNSHSHADHWLGNAGFSNVEIIASTKAISVMKKYGKEDIAAFSRMTKGATSPTHAQYPSYTLKHPEKRTLGGVEFEFIFSNDAHSSGDILVWLPKQKIIIGGDVLNSEWMPIITPGANVPNLINTLYSVVKLNPKIVLTGHGKATTIQSVIRDADLLESLWKIVNKGQKSGKNIDDILLHASSKLDAKFRLLYNNYDDHIKYQVKAMYKMH